MDNGWARPIVAFLLILCSGAVYVLVAMGWANVAWMGVVNLIIGALIANLTAVVQYYFGSSKGSTDKNATIDALLKTKTTP